MLIVDSAPTAAPRAAVLMAEPLIATRRHGMSNCTKRVASEFTT